MKLLKILEKRVQNHTKALMNLQQKTIITLTQVQQKTMTLLAVVQMVLALCDFWDWEKVALVKNRVRQIDRSNERKSR